MTHETVTDETLTGKNAAGKDVTGKSATSGSATGGNTAGESAARAVPARRRTGRTAADKLVPLTGFVLFLAALQLLPTWGVVSEESLPRLSRMIGSLADQAGGAQFWTAVGDTVRTWAIGLGVALVAGVVVGVVIGLVPVLREITSSTIEFLRPIPSVALIPVAVLVFGTGFESGVFLILYAGFWQVLLQVLYGVRDADPVALETARSYRLGRWGTLRHVLWPTALPYIFTGVRLAASVALVLAVTAELVIGTPGLGNEIATAKTGGDLTKMYALILVTGVLGVAVNIAARALEKKFMWWHSSVRRSKSGA
ncbi:ABC transporter permease [Streptomyces halstedii]|uniref:ABC transporter permease n=1 Tax=Streptomyces halstedii TaxID=1944 RepID=UPI00381BC89A